MNIVGKLIGALSGYLLMHNPFGILLGIAIGHLWDSGALRLSAPRRVTPNSFIEPLFGLAGAIAKSDGRVSEQEIAATENLMQRMQLSRDQRARAIAQFSAGKNSGYAAHLAIADLKAWSSGRRDLAYLLLDMLLDIVCAEGPLVQPKLLLVRKLCWSLGVHEQELASLAAMKGYTYAAPGGGPYQQHEQPQPQRDPSEKDPYVILGIQRGASAGDIKRAYRRLMSQHHPDKLGDVPDELKRRAEERARDINAAYERIRVERQIK